MNASITKLARLLAQNPSLAGQLKSANPSEIASVAQRSGINLNASDIAQFVSNSGVRELHSSDLSAVVGGKAPTPEQCTKFFTFPSTTWTF
jgi:hypothetical protein